MSLCDKGVEWSALLDPQNELPRMLLITSLPNVDTESEGEWARNVQIHLQKRGMV